jgi:F-type H+-transporting ATPase subunit a
VIQATLLSGFLLIVAGILVRKRISAEGGGLVPDEGVTVRNLMEVLVDALANLARDRIGEDWRKYFPIVGTMFFFILISNLLGLIPGVGSATSDINTTAGWAIISWAVYTWAGVVKHKGDYATKFMGPILWRPKLFGRQFRIRVLAPFMIIIEVPLDLARMVTLSIRLLANMFADHTVIGVWIMLVPIGVPAIFMGLGVVIAFLQAFIFALLTMIYIGLALEEPH